MASYKLKQWTPPGSIDRLSETDLNSMMDPETKTCTQLINTYNYSTIWFLETQDIITTTIKVDMHGLNIGCTPTACHNTRVYLAMVVGQNSFAASNNRCAPFCGSLVSCGSIGQYASEKCTYVCTCPTKNGSGISVMIPALHRQHSIICGIKLYI